jgi:uncharacterized protein (DUF885 family)
MPRSAWHDTLEEMTMTMRHALLGAALLCALPAAAKAPAVAQLHQLFDAEWERDLRESPESASYFGDPRYNDRWTDMSPAAIELRENATRAALVRLVRIPRAALPPSEQVNYDLFKRQLELGIEYQRFELEQMPVAPTNWNGFGYATTLAQLMRFTTVKDYEDWIRRLETYGALVDQNIALMRLGIRDGRTPPRAPMERIPAQLRTYAPDRPEDSPLYAPLTRIPESIAPADAERLRARARTAIAEVVTPAWRRFAEFFQKDYLPACRPGFAAEGLPDGVAYYALRVRDQTTTHLTPDQIHAIGLAEVARIRAEMEKVMLEVKFRGNLQEFFRFLRTDPQFFFKTGDELFKAYALITKRIDPELVRLFGRLPRTPYGVRPIPDGEAPNATTAYYQGPAEDGSRAGYFYTNLYRPETRPKWEMEALTVHEAVPGHHLQIALAQELGDLPKFRRLGGYTAFVEGWGLYAESLGGELGLYQDPYSRFGQLTYEMWRAVRLVVDTGLHHKGWTRQQAIDYFSANAAKTENDIAVEVDRYIGDPGQALAYKIGELKIKELRARARDTLGPAFDVRAFHDVVLGYGAVPLDVLESNVDAWIAARKAAGN